MSSSKPSPFGRPVPLDTRAKLWNRYIRAHLPSNATNEPYRVDVAHIRERELALLADLLEFPKQSLASLDSTLSMMGTPRSVQVLPLPEEMRVDIGAIRAEHVGRLVTARAVVIQTSARRAFIESALFQCPRCEKILRVPQEDEIVAQPPFECYEDQGGCGREADFRIVLDPAVAESAALTDVRHVYLQSPTPARGETPFSAILRGEMADACQGGDLISITGIVGVRAQEPQQRDVDPRDPPGAAERRRRTCRTPTRAPARRRADPRAHLRSLASPRARARRGSVRGMRAARGSALLAGHHARGGRRRHRGERQRAMRGVRGTARAAG